jgi:general secretion pathway protein K
MKTGREKPNKKRWSGNQKGVALLITLFAVLIMTFLAVEVSYNTRVELTVGASQLDRLKAYYLARSGVQISLLRVALYKNVVRRFGAQLGAQKGMLDLIWQFPFAWPPAAPAELSEFDKSEIDEAVKQSYIEGSFLTTIEGEGAKIDINDLGSPSETLRKAVAAQLVLIIQNRLDAEDEWARNNRDLKVEELVNNIIDWVDENKESINGGAEDSPYARTDPPIIPPNRPMKTLEELHMVAGITDEVFNLLAPRVTVYGTKGINVNLAGKEVLKSLDPQMKDEIVDKILERRNDPNQGPFGNANEFVEFIRPLGINTETFNKKPEIPLLFDAEYNFRIRSTGIYKRAQREIIAIAYDFDKVKGQLFSLLPTPTPTPPPPGGAAGATPSPTPTPGGGDTAGPGNSGPPAIVFWQEF